MKIAVRRRLAALAALSMTATVAAVVLTVGESSATVVSVTPAAAGNFAPQPTTVTFKLQASSATSTTPSGRVPLGSNVQFIRSGVPERDAFDSTVDNYAGTPPDSSQPQTFPDFSNVTDDSTGNREGPANPGTYDVRFSDPSFVQTLDMCSSCFTVVAAGPPTVASANPNRVASNTTANVTFIGANFARGTSFAILPSTANTATDIKVVQARNSSNTKIPPTADGKNYFATVTVPAGAALGPRDIQAINTDGQTSICSGCFTVLGANLTSVSPTGSTNNDTDNARSITIIGPAGSIASDGVPSLAFVGDPGAVTRESLNIPGTVTSRAADGSSVTANFNLAAAAPGSNAYQPTVASASGGSVNVCSCRFSIVQAGVPTLTTISPNTQDRATTQQVTVGGTNFARGTNVLVAGGGVTTTAIEFISRTQLKATLSVTSDATPGKRDVTAKLTDGRSSAVCTGCYTINGASPGPSVSPTASRSATPSSSPCPSGQASSTASPTATSSSTGTASPTATASATGTASPTATASATGTASPTATASATGTASPTATASPTGTASPTATASATGTASPTATASPTGSAQPSSSCTPTSSSSPTPTRQTLTLTTSDTNIPAGSTATLRASGQPNQAYSLQCYSRPSVEYREARSGSFDAAGSPVEFTISLGRNTRCFIRYVTNSTQGQSNSIVVNVRTVLSLSTVRTATRTYLFQGRNLPRVAGQLITLYRVDAAGNEIRTSNLVTDDSGIYRVTRKFTGTGTFRFKVRTSQTLNNAAGVSNTISVAVR